jgi:rhodanese-related sulfurtransferase
MVVKYIVMGLIIMAFGGVFTGCAYAERAEDTSKNGYIRITPDQANQMLQDNPQVILIDVRTPREYAQRHIPNARLVPNETIAADAIAGLDKEDVILVYCRTGHRSWQAAQKLLDMGYQHIYDMEGGITQWPYETVTE